MMKLKSRMATIFTPADNQTHLPACTTNRINTALRVSFANSHRGDFCRLTAASSYDQDPCMQAGQVRQGPCPAAGCISNITHGARSHLSACATVRFQAHTCQIQVDGDIDELDPQKGPRGSRHTSSGLADPWFAAGNFPSHLHRDRGSLEHSIVGR